MKRPGCLGSLLITIIALVASGPPVGAATPGPSAANAWSLKYGLTVNDTIFSMSLPDGQNGLAGTETELLKTADGGATRQGLKGGSTENGLGLGWVFCLDAV